jgi:hypothetical protein
VVQVVPFEVRDQEGAAAVVSLASDDAAVIQGTILPIDGGKLAV